MQTFWTLTRRELASYFLSMTGYIVIAATMFLLGFSFLDLLKQLQMQPTPMPVTELFYNTWYFWLILILTTPVITMRLFALEKFSGTFETLMTAPVTELQVVMAKFAAGVVFFIVLWLPLLACLFALRHYTGQSAGIDSGVVFSTFLGIVLLGSLFISLGLFASALTRSQVAAAMLALGCGATIFLVGILADHLPPQTTWQGQILATLAFFDQMHDFTRGVVDSRPVILYATLTLFFLFLTLRVVETRRWK
jgi:ABC-2 type transport system permease protein